MKRAWRHSCLLMLLGPFALVAQTPNPANVTETVQALLDRIDRLEKRVAELEVSTTAARPATPPPPQPPAAPQSTAQSPQPAPGSHEDHVSGAETAQGVPQ
ncbi:MAG: hypothetical protein LAO55_15995 [Acidobacteriia bacterium]|nr:hypothetical protein [Terriglobia bacterium]